MGISVEIAVEITAEEVTDPTIYPGRYIINSDTQLLTQSPDSKENKGKYTIPIKLPNGTVTEDAKRVIWNCESVALQFLIVIATKELFENRLPIAQQNSSLQAITGSKIRSSIDQTTISKLITAINAAADLFAADTSHHLTSSEAAKARVKSCFGTNPPTKKPSHKKQSSLPVLYTSNQIFTFNFTIKETKPKLRFLKSTANQFTFQIQCAFNGPDSVSFKPSTSNAPFSSLATPSANATTIAQRLRSLEPSRQPRQHRSTSVVLTNEHTSNTTSLLPTSPDSAPASPDTVTKIGFATVNQFLKKRSRAKAAGSTPKESPSLQSIIRFWKETPAQPTSSEQEDQPPAHVTEPSPSPSSLHASSSSSLPPPPPPITPSST